MNYFKQWRECNRGGGGKDLLYRDSCEIGSNGLFGLKCRTDDLKLQLNMKMYFAGTQPQISADVSTNLKYLKKS